MKLTLYRYHHHIDRTEGHLFFDRAYLCDTLELPWKGNYRRISCIPTGLYTATYSEAHSHKPCYEVETVEGRDGILIHVANYAFQLQGCIAVGEKHGNSVTNSRDTLERVVAKAGKGVIDFEIAEIP